MPLNKAIDPVHPFKSAMRNSLPFGLHLSRTNHRLSDQPSTRAVPDSGSLLFRDHQWCIFVIAPRVCVCYYLATQIRSELIRINEFPVFHDLLFCSDKSMDQTNIAFQEVRLVSILRLLQIYQAEPRHPLFKWAASKSENIKLQYGRIRVKMNKGMIAPNWFLFTCQVFRFDYPIATVGYLKTVSPLDQI